MKYKAFIISVLVVFAGVFISCSSDDTIPDDEGQNSIEISYSELPVAAQSFLETNFPEVTVNSVRKLNKPDAVGTLYLTQLANNFKVNFNQTGQWTTVNSNGQSVPDNLVIPAIVEYVNQNYPGLFITEIELENNGYEVELSNGIELYFDLDGNFISEDLDEDEDEVSITYDELPQAAKDLLNEFFPNVNLISIQKEVEDGQIEYEVKLANGFEIDFDADGSWTSIDGNGQAVPSGLIPEAILIYIQSQYPDVFVEEIEMKSQGYKVELSNDTDLYFDAEGNFISSDDDSDDDDDEAITYDELPQIAKDLLNEFFPNINGISVQKETENGQIEYEVKLANGFEIDFDSEGNWLKIDGNSQQIPDGLIPQDILSYVQTNHPGVFIEEIELENNKYEVGLSNDSDLYFDLQGNFLGYDD